MMILRCYHKTKTHGSARHRSLLPDGRSAHSYSSSLHFYFLFLIFYFLFLPVRAQVGTWRSYLAYHEVQQIQDAGSDLFVMASDGLYQYNKTDQSITTYDKTNGLNDTGIAKIRWCQQAHRLVVVYKNSNIDLVDTNGNVTNISDIYTKAMTGDKSINNIYVNGQYAYLAAGFGVVKLNVKNADISESYMLGFPVTAVAIQNGTLYARSQSGTVWAAPLTANLIDKSNWQLATTTALPSFADDTTDYDNNIQLVSTLNPGGPKYNYFGSLNFVNNQLYTCGGLIQNIPGCIQTFKDGEWKVYQDEGIEDITGLPFASTYSIDYDPLDNTHLFAGARNGLYEFQNGEFVKFYNNENSPIEPYNGISKNYQLVTGVKFDANGNLWILNSEGITQSIIEFTKDRKFVSHITPELMKLDNSGIKNKSNANMCNMMFDSKGYLWFVNNNWQLPAAYRYNITDGSIQEFSNFVNQDGINVGVHGGVTCIAEDTNYNFWIGTNVGPLLLEKEQVESNNPIYTQVKVPRNDGTNLADYLLAGSYIQSMAIDKGGRKWFGTNGNGVYLISSDNMEQLQHFTIDNSPLPSNVIHSITINNGTGEVFFGTENGLCSYMSDASAANDEMNTDNVWAYPNPVTPDYGGLVTIMGLSLNADVKILTASGTLVNEGRSNGGTFTWDCRDKKGHRVASGVYMVATATKDGKKGTVCKIAIVN